MLADFRNDHLFIDHENPKKEMLCSEIGYLLVFGVGLLVGWEAYKRFHCNLVRGPQKGRERFDPHQEANQKQIEVLHSELAKRGYGVVLLEPQDKTRAFIAIDETSAGIQ